jgi:hypothetical protein
MNLVGDAHRDGSRSVSIGEDTVIVAQGNGNIAPSS